MPRTPLQDGSCPRTLDVANVVRYVVGMGQLNYPIPDDLHRELKARAAREGVTLKELVIRLLREGLERKDD